MLLFLLLGFLAQLIAGQDCGPVCELDAFGRRLTFPNPVVATKLYATTVHVATYRDLKGAYIVQTSTKTADPPPKPTITWEVSGVTLTYPTTYVIYTSFVHTVVITESACATRASSLRLGPSTNYASLIYPASVIDGTLPPAGLINYLEGIPTVLGQLGGTVNSSCDPTSTSAFASAPTATLTTTDFLPSATVSTQTVTVSAAFETISGSALTLPVTTPRFRNTTTTVPVPGPSSTSTTTRTSSIRLSSSAVGSTTVTFSGAISSIERTSPPLPPLATGTGAFPGGATSPGGNFSATASATSSIQEVTTNLANRFADAAYMGTGGWLASILGLAIYYL